MIQIPENELAGLVMEAEDIFLGLSFVLQNQLGPISESPMYSSKKAFFRPLNRSKPSESELYCTRILRILIEECRGTGDSDHLFLKNASPLLRNVLESDTFGDESPLIAALLAERGLSRLYTLQSKSKGPFWSLKALIEFRARKIVKGRSRNFAKLAKVLLRTHQEESLLVII